MDPLEVQARKGILKESPTSIILPCVTSDDDGGWSFVIESAAIPHGNFRIEIALADQDGEETVQTYYFQITRQL
jgi:hypothetical protein